MSIPYAPRFFPDPLRSIEDYQRLHHRDMIATSTALLVREHARAAQVLSWISPHHPWNGWLEERLVALEDELAARRANSRPVTTIEASPARPAQRARGRGERVLL